MPDLTHIQIGTTTYDICDATARDTYLPRSSVLDLIYPVGSIYMSVNSTSPDTLFGGTWTRITGKFLLAATDTSSNSGASQAAGQEGGAATVTLTTQQIPSHTHSMSHTHTMSHKHTGPSHTHNYSKSNTTTGSTTLTAAQSGLPAHTHSFTQPTISSHSHDTGFKAEASFEAGTNRYGYVNGTGSKDTGKTAPTASGGAVGAVTGGAKNASSGHTHSITLTTTATTSAGTGTTGGSSASNTGDSSAANTGSTGGGTSHDNMPPFLSVYVWKRTA